MELLKCCRGALANYIVMIFTTVWEEQHVPAEWNDAILVPVLKERHLSYGAETWAPMHTGFG